MAAAPPTKKKNVIESAYRMAMRLWSVVSSQDHERVSVRRDSSRPAWRRASVAIRRASVIGGLLRPSRRADIGDERMHLVVADQAGVARHDRLVARDDVALAAAGSSRADRPRRPSRCGRPRDAPCRPKRPRSSGACTADAAAWQPEQPSARNSASPSRARSSRLRLRARASAHSRPGSITTTSPVMRACSVPQNSRAEQMVTCRAWWRWNQVSV